MKKLLVFLMILISPCAFAAEELSHFGPLEIGVDTDHIGPFEIGVDIDHWGGLELPSSGTTETFGYDVTSSSDQPTDTAGRLRCRKVTVPASNGALTRIRCYAEEIDDADHEIILTVHADDGSANVGTHKASCVKFYDASIGTGTHDWTDWQTLAAESGQDLNVTAGSTIWLCRQVESSESGYDYHTVTSGDAEYTNGTFETIPDGPLTDSTYGIVIQVEYEY